jgi:small subunit ribosomal protein S6
MSEYELVLMLDPESPDERREEIASNARSRIESAGSLKADNVWGLRKLAYEIKQRNEADYRFYRFEAESPLLDDLNHNLKITDGVLRFRIFKVDPESPVIEPPPPAPLASPSERRGPGGRGRGRGRDDHDRGEAPAPTPAPAQQQAAPAQTEAPAQPEAPAQHEATSPAPAGEASPPAEEAPAPAEPAADSQASGEADESRT